MLVKRVLFYALCLAAALSMCFSGTGCFTKTGTVTGLVLDATNGLPVSGVSVSCDDASTTTGSNGRFTLVVEIGQQTLRFTKTGYFSYSLTVFVEEDATTEIETPAMIAPTVGTGQVRIVLSWGAEPRDLDSHLWTPSDYHVYYGDEGAADASPWAWLDVDDVTSYGPETITITSVQSGTYYYSVHNYSGEHPLSQSGAKVEVYNHSGLVRTFYVPASGTGDWWNIFSMNGGAITTINAIADDSSRLMDRTMPPKAGQ